jgi:hypothetical protein
MNLVNCGKTQYGLADRCMNQDPGHMKLQQQFRKRVTPFHQAYAAILCFVWMIFAFTDAGAQSISDTSQASLPPGVGFEIEALPEVAAIGDSIQIDIHVTTPADYQVEIASPESQTGDFTILDYFPDLTVPETEATKKPIPTGTLQHHRARIIAAVYKVGKFVFPSFPITITASDGQKTTFSSPPLNIEIKSVLTDENPTLKDLKKQAELSEHWRWLIWLVIAIAAGLLGVLIWYYRRRRRNRPVSPSPEQKLDLLALAEADLKELLERGLPDNGRVKRFYVILSDIVKRILESGYEVHTAEQTTSEIVGSLQIKSGLERENVKRVESFLIRCDVVKFAKYIPSRVEHQAVSEDALQILAEAKRAVASRRLPVAGD